MADAASGPRFGRYRLRGRVATGGMGEVYKAFAQGFDGVEKVVAIKLIRDSLASEPDLVKMFVEEAKVAFLLSHANVVQTFDVGTIDGQYFIAMEYVEGRTLSHLLRACRNSLGQLLPQRHAVYVVVEALKGLNHAHRAKDAKGNPLGIVHRDVSPSNILVSIDGEVKVSDFGIAWSTMKSHKSELGAIKGKVPYMPPEQVRGARLDGRADVYAVGAVLYEALTGRPPFVGPSGALIPLVLESKFPHPRELNPEIPEELEAIVLRAMAPVPDDRFESAAAMRDALEELALHKVWRLSSTDLAAFAEAVDAAPPAEGTPAGDAFDAALGQELCKVADGEGALSVFTSALPSPSVPPAPTTESTTPDVPLKVGSAVATAPPPATREMAAPRASQAPPTQPEVGAPTATPQTASSYERALARPQGRRFLVWYVAAAVVVAVGAAVAARSGPDRDAGVPVPGETGGTAGAALAAPVPPTPVVSPPALAPSPPSPPPPVAAAPDAAAPLPVGIAPPTIDPTPPSGPGETPDEGGPDVAGPGSPTQPATPTPPPDEGADRPAGAVLVINTEPWTHVEIDGVRVGTTPIVGRRVRAGHHSIVLTNPAHGLRRAVSVTLREGERRRIVLDLAAGNAAP